MHVEFIIPATNGSNELGELGASRFALGNNQVAFEFYTDAECTTLAPFVAGLITVQAKPSKNASWVDLPDGADMDMSLDTSPLRFAGVCDYINVTCNGVTGANYIKVIVNKYSGVL